MNIEVREMITGNNPHVRPTRRQRHHDDGKSLLVPSLLYGTMIPDFADLVSLESFSSELTLAGVLGR